MEMIALLLLILCIVFIARLLWSGTRAAIRTSSESVAVISAKTASSKEPKGAGNKKGRADGLGDIALPLAAGIVIAAAAGGGGIAGAGSAGSEISDGGSTDWINDPM